MTDPDEEYLLCRDPVYFYENYLLINGKKPPILTEAQKKEMREVLTGECRVVRGRSNTIIFKMTQWVLNEMDNGTKQP